MKNQNRGQIRIIEAFLAVLIIFSSFAVSANLSAPQKRPRQNELASVGLQTLVKLDSDGTLGKYIDERNWGALRGALDLALPTGLTFNLTVYDERMTLVNTDIISNGAPTSQDVTHVEHVVASRGMVFHCYVIHLYLSVAS